MAAVARITASLYRLSDHLLHPRVSPASRAGCSSLICGSSPPCLETSTKNVRLRRLSVATFPASSSSGFGRRRNSKTAARHSSSKSGELIDMESGASSSLSTSTAVAVLTREESSSDCSPVFHNCFELATPLCERPGSSIASLIDVCRWKNQAQELATSVGSEFVDADGGPEVSDLLRELEWLLDDVVAACAPCLENLSVHSSTWKACAWRDVRDVGLSRLDRGTSFVTNGPQEVLAALRGDVSAIYGAFGALCKERHTDPVNEFAADCGCSCDGIRESLAEMTSVDENSTETGEGVDPSSTFISRLDNLEENIDGRPRSSSLRIIDLQLLLRMSIDDLDKAWKERIQRRRPFQYVVAAAHWRDLVLGVAEGVLIPRPETEQIVDLVEEAISSDKSLGQGLWTDLGTGSGAIAIAIARLLEPSGSVVAVDASTVALAVARRNVERHSLQNKVKVLQGFWFSPFEDKAGQLAGVVSNPPYIPSDNLAGLQAEVGKHEPTIALDGGPDGMDDLRKICSGSAILLRQGGFLALETNGGEQAGAICELLSKMRVFESTGIPVCCFRDVLTVKDFTGITRFVTAKRC